MDSWLKTENLRNEVLSTSSEDCVGAKTVSKTTCDTKKGGSSMNVPKRKYDENYLNWGFTFTVSTDSSDALRVLCDKIRVSYRIASNDESHTIGEALIKPCEKDSMLHLK